MFDCADDVLAHHDKEVTLPQSDRTAMRDRRNANRDRLKGGLKENDKPKPREFKSQGSYAMKTMVQHPDNSYDIDDGVYFDKEALIGGRGAEMSALQVRQMVRDAVDDGSFKTPPEVREPIASAFITRRDIMSICRPIAASWEKISSAKKRFITNSRATIGSARTPAM